MPANLNFAILGVNLNVCEWTGGKNRTMSIGCFKNRLQIENYLNAISFYVVQLVLCVHILIFHLVHFLF